MDVDNAIEIGRKISKKIDGKCFGNITLKKRDKAKNFTVKRKSVIIDDNKVRLSSEIHHKDCFTRFGTKTHYQRYFRMNCRLLHYLCSMAMVKCDKITSLT